MAVKFCESAVEEASLEWAEEMDYGLLHGPEIAPAKLGPSDSRTARVPRRSREGGHRQAQFEAPG